MRVVGGERFDDELVRARRQGTLGRVLGAQEGERSRRVLPAVLAVQAEGDGADARPGDGPQIQVVAAGQLNGRAVANGAERRRTREQFEARHGQKLRRGRGGWRRDRSRGGSADRRDLDAGQRCIADDAGEAEAEGPVVDRHVQRFRDDGLAAAGSDDVEVVQDRGALGADVEHPLTLGGIDGVREIKLNGVGAVGDRQVVVEVGTGPAVVVDQVVGGAGHVVRVIGRNAAGEAEVGGPMAARVVGVGGAAGVDKIGVRRGGRGEQLTGLQPFYRRKTSWRCTRPPGAERRGTGRGEIRQGNLSVAAHRAHKSPRQHHTRARSGGKRIYLGYSRTRYSVSAGSLIVNEPATLRPSTGRAE